MPQFEPPAGVSTAAPATADHAPADADAGVAWADGAWARDRFPIFEHSVYLNSCSGGALSVDVAAAYHAYLSGRHDRGADWPAWLEVYEDVRGRLARLVGAAPDEVALGGSASAVLGPLASALEPTLARDRIVVTDLDFPTTAHIWRAQAARGFEVVTAEAPGGRLSLDRLTRLIDRRTRLVSLPLVCYRNGALSDVAAVADLARAAGAWVLVDAYQALGAVPVDLGKLGADFLLGGTAKYLLGSAGLGFLVVRRDLVAGLTPTQTGWFGQDDIFAMDHRHHRPAATARRFETGTPPVPSLYAAQAGLGLMDRVGVARTWAHVATLTERLKAGAAALGATLATPAAADGHGALIAIRAVDDAALVARLAARGVITSSRDGNVRVSPHFYNNADDIDACLDALAAERALLA
ncbi:selenocysteine lyase/cysteine desulfurase [Rhodothalassium salexigens DSM 2132]|uniref:Selenocysteine lyase/cysteine desulfurase n=1 Tax=Rhodothalassium salexigens DSM 2132 TaxID=1188247 RepID=A0A4R2PPR9_RHOSA|nr:aminotransferase class V-fold PLP-dependent enzyme [Rhodothalassium salexigens]MBB4210798.1 selenocysteine lyase/cysteine desulfurase [Rhodothalassium salexigens DSM 2132]MBK1639131.1 hypothetical protein [Rhodothalassium salexigens DSM 2132]TCP37647.1 selenocysteine lyase/cysteine desulfurase [Rhodothalassium salexigens DSM 2132]